MVEIELPYNPEDEKPTAAQLEAGKTRRKLAGDISNTRAGARGGRKRDQVSAFWREGHPEHLRMVHASEQHIDFPEIARGMSHTQNEVARTLRASKTAVIKQIASELVQQHKARVQPSAMTFAHAQKLDDQLVPILESGYAAQRKQVFAEHERLTHKPLADPRSVTLAARPGAQSPPELVAEGTVQKMMNQYIKSAGNIAAANVGDPLDETDVENSLQQLSDGFIDNLAGEAARNSVRAARSDAFSEIMNALREAGMHVVRICAMEDRSCQPCKDADGTEVEPDADLSEICEGGELCLCQPSEEPE